MVRCWNCLRIPVLFRSRCLFSSMGLLSVLVTNRMSRVFRREIMVLYCMVWSRCDTYDSRQALISPTVRNYNAL